VELTFPDDRADTQPVAIINQAMAQKFWPGRSPVGRPAGVPIRKNDMTIVGMVGSIKHLSLREEPRPEIYVLYTQKPWPSMLTMEVAMRTTAGFAAAAADARAAIRSVDPGLPLANLQTLDDIVDDSMTQPRFAMLLVALFGAVAVTLASVGMYGVISYSVAHRTQEIGIRMALGAGNRELAVMILAQGARMIVAGIVIGIGAALLAGRALNSFLYEVRPNDPITLTAVAFLLIAVGLAACYILARRAMRLDPNVALRCN